MTVIYKVLRGAEFRELQDKGETLGSPLDIADGFIHFSTVDTLAGTLAKYFDGVQGLKLVAYDDNTMGEVLKYEPARCGVLFPHLYGPLRHDDALWVKDLPVDEKTGKHTDFPKDLK